MVFRARGGCDPALFADCFQSGAIAMHPGAPALVGIDGKTSRGSHDRPRGRAALHLVSALATRERLVVGPQAGGRRGKLRTGDDPLLLERLSTSGGLDGAVVTIDAIASNPGAAAAIIDAAPDYLLAAQANQPGLMDEIERFFDDPATCGIDRCEDVDQGHGRIEERSVAANTQIDWLARERRTPPADIVAL